MRILLVSAHGSDPKVGGVEKGIGMLTAELQHRGHAVSLVRSFPGGSPQPGVETTVLHDSDWRADPAGRLRTHVGDVVSRPTRRLARIIAQHRPDVVHTHNLPGITTGIWEVCRREGLPVLHTLHDYHLLCPRTTLMLRDGATPCQPHPLLCGLRTRSLARWADAVSNLTGVSGYIVGVHAHLFRSAKKHVVRNPMVSLSPGPLRPPSDRLRSIGYIGSLDRIKGIGVLLQAAPVLSKLGCELHIAGGGRLVAEVEAVAARLSAVYYHGVVSGRAKEDFLERCDVGLIPSIWAEPGGPTHTMVEWLTAGRPLLVSTNGGLGEVIDHHAGAIAVEPTVDGIIAAVSELSEPAAWHHAVARVGVADSQAELNRWVDTYEAIYRSMA